MRKTCTKCCTEKALEAFSIQRRNKDGRDSRCKSCASKHAIKWARENAERARANVQRWMADNREHRAAYLRAWFDENREHRAAWRKANAEALAQSFKLWAANNRDRMLAKSARRRAALLERTPVWVNHDDFLPVYAQREAMSRATGIEHHVDHIVPLRGELVSGLHVPWNLQVIPAAANKSKKNKFPV